MKDAALLALKSLANFSSDSQTRITFIVSGQPELRARLKLAQHYALKQRIRLFYHMKPVSLEETCLYIDYHTKAAGSPTPLFSDAAKADIHRHADGIPRIVNTLCYRSIINAAVRNLKVVDSADVFLEEPGNRPVISSAITPGGWMHLSLANKAQAQPAGLGNEAWQATELLSAAAQKELPQIDEKLYFDVVTLPEPPKTHAPPQGPAKVKPR